MWREPSRTSQRSPTLESLGNKHPEPRRWFFTFQWLFSIFQFFNSLSFSLVCDSIFESCSDWWRHPHFLFWDMDILSIPFRDFRRQTPRLIPSYSLLSRHSNIFVIEWSCSHAIVLFFILHFAIVSFTPGSGNPAQEVTLGRSQLITVPQELQKSLRGTSKLLQILTPTKLFTLRMRKPETQKSRLACLPVPFDIFYLLLT